MSLVTPVFEKSQVVASDTDFIFVLAAELL